ncbi:hypothetical protein [Microbacterium istanbulense]|uniref:Uncharacterized protein n=1 Tax=Microbacterium istanbulense TaxID=3122049 RepID=A0ABU8LLR3_9MICO
MTPTDTDPRAARTEARASLDALYLSPAASRDLRTRIHRAKVNDLPSILQEAADRREVENAQLREKYADLLAAAKVGFLTDTGIAIQIAEDARAIKDHHRAKDDPEAVRDDARRLRAQGATYAEIERTLRISRERLVVFLRDEPEPKPLTHGTLSTYTNYKCRCDACRKAATDHARAYRERKAREAQAEK